MNTRVSRLFLLLEIIALSFSLIACDELPWLDNFIDFAVNILQSEKESNKDVGEAAPDLSKLESGSYEIIMSVEKTITALLILPVK